MGIFRAVNNRKRSEQEAHPRRWRRQANAAKKAAKGPITINVEDPEFFSKELLKNKLKNPRNNIKLSAKNRKRTLKRLKHEMRDKQKTSEKEKDKDFVTDLFMEDEESAETEAPAEMAEKTDDAPGPSSSKASLSSASTSAAAGSTTKKNKRGGRKKRKGKGDAEDVEMEEM